MSVYQRKFGAENPLKFDCVTFMTLTIRHRFREVRDWFPPEDETYRLPADLQAAHWYGNAPQRPDQAAMQNDEAADLEELADVTRPFGSERWHAFDRMPLVDRLSALSLFYDDLTCDLQSLRQRCKSEELENYTGPDSPAGELKKLVRYRQRVARKIERVRGLIKKEEKRRRQLQEQRERLRVVSEISGRAREEKQASAEWQRQLELLAYLADAKAKSDHYANKGPAAQRAIRHDRIPDQCVPNLEVPEESPAPVVRSDSEPRSSLVKSPAKARRQTRKQSGLWLAPITEENLGAALGMAKEIFPHAWQKDGFGPCLAYRTAILENNPKVQFYLASFGSVLVGLTGHYLSLPHQISLGWLGVLPEHRRRGYGEKILRATADMVARLGVRELTLYSYDQMEEREAQRLFLRAGFEMTGPGMVQDERVLYFHAWLPLRFKSEEPYQTTHMALFADVTTEGASATRRLTLCLDFEKMCRRYDIRSYGCSGLPLCLLPMTEEAARLARTFWDGPAMLHYASPFDATVHGSVRHAKLFSDLCRIGVGESGIAAMLKAAM